MALTTDLPVSTRHPITAPGERLTPEVIDYPESLAAAGVMVEGAADESLAQFRITVKS